MWIHIRTAPNKVIAEMWVEFLENQWIPAKIKPIEEDAHLGMTAPHRIYVPTDRVKVAAEILRNC
ncbi:MAG: hypothetical protein KJ734_07640 [Chloroflexi bacterium]|nr:hypothetical protein [Chloroflexota bacterium]